jgi:hypothetical protein
MHTNLDLSQFWLWWFLTALLALGQILRAVRHPWEVLAFPTIASSIWLFCYNYLSYQLIRTQPHVFTADAWTFAQMTACVSLACLLVGWHGTVGTSRGLSRQPRSLAFDMDRLWFVGIAAMVIGLVGWRSFLRSGRIDAETTAYWYMLYNLAFPGASLCVLVLTLSPRRRSAFRCLLLTFLAGLIFLPFMLTARRGPTCAAITALAFSYFAVRDKPPRASLVLATIGATGLLMLLLYSSRSTIESGGLFFQYLKEANVQEVLTEKGQEVGDNEFYNHCELIQANRETGLYQYGTGHLAMLLHWIPRSWWAGKPARSLGFFPEAALVADKGQQSNLGNGGGWGAVADSFNNYAWGFPVYWIVIGWLTGALFLKAQQSGALQWKMANIGLLCSSHWYITQSLGEAFVPFMFFQGVYFIGFWMATPPRAAADPSRSRPTEKVSGAEEQRVGDKARKLLRLRQNS